MLLGAYLDGWLARDLTTRVINAVERRGIRLARRATGFTLASAVVLGAIVVWLQQALLPAGWLVILGSVCLLGLSRLPSQERLWAAWGRCAVATMVLLLVGVGLFLPGFADTRSMRGQVEPLLESGLAADAPVVCYPQRWNSVSFYLQRDDVQVYSENERTRMLEALRDRSETVVFVRSGKSLDELLEALPPGMEFVFQGAPGPVTVGSVRYRAEAPAGWYALAGP